MRLLVLSAVVTTMLVVEPVSAQAPEFATTRIADGVYQFRYRGHNTMFVSTAEGVVVFDPISVEAANHLVSEIRRVISGPRLRAVVYSHHHADHATGAPVVMEALGSAPIVAHDAASAPLTEANDPNLPAPDLTFADRFVFRSADRAVELRFLGASHGDDLIVGIVPSERVIFAVDFITSDGVGYRDLGSHHFPDFYDTLDSVLTLEMDRVIFGHGPPGDRAAVQRQRRYYHDLRDAVSRALGAGLTEDEAAEQVTLPAYAEWRGYDAMFGLNVRGVYRWLAETGRE